MPLITLLTTCLLLATTATTPAHEYHISKTNLRYVAEREQMQVEMHLFVDDLEKDMVSYGAPDNLELGTKIQHEEAERYLKQYLDRHFRVTLDATRLPLGIVGYELEDDLHGFWVYLAAEDVPAPTKISVNNSLLTETFPDQKNIVKIFSGEVRGATLLMSKARTAGEVTL